MKAAVCFTMLVVVLVEGQTSQAYYNIQCYKKTTDLDPVEDFTCTWSPVMPLQNATYNLFYQAPGHPAYLLCSVPDLSCIVYRDGLITKRMIRMWLEVDTTNQTYRSANFTMILDFQVKYDAPEFKKISRSSKKLTLWLEKQSGEKNGAVYELALRRPHYGQWRNETFETRDGLNTPETYTVHLEHDTSYEVRTRRRAKQVPGEIWSDWSQIKQVPTELDSQPKVEWKVGEFKNGVRLLKLTLEEYSRTATFGGLTYQISTSPVSCWHDMHIVYTNRTNYNLTITADTVNVTVHANNTVGASPETRIIIPAHYFDTCRKDQAKNRKAHQKKGELCIVWHRFASETPKPDDENHRTVNNRTQAFEIMKEEMEDFVRYHYFINTKKRTIDLCPVYKKEGVPSSSPGSLTVLNKTHNSAVLQWEPIPVSEQRGFLTDYIIYISGPNGAKIEKVPGFQTNFTMQDLEYGSVYSVYLAGQTSVGLGPNCTETFQMNPNPHNVKGLSSSDKIIVTSVVALSLLAVCILIIKCITSKLLPVVPSPIIPETATCRTENDDGGYPNSEEVHSLILQFRTPGDGDWCGPQQPEEERCGTPFYEQPDGESQTDSEGPDGSGVPLSPDYKRQILSPPPLLSHPQSRCDTIPAYKNGLVLEMRENASEELTESGPVLG